MNEAQIRILENNDLAEAAAALPVEEREHFLVTNCRDADQLAAVRELLSTATDSSSLVGFGLIGRSDESLPSGLPVPTPGESIDGFVIERTIGEGGMGQVHIARQINADNRQVALKTFKFSMLLSDAENLKRLQKRAVREIRAVAKCNHPNIVTCYSAGREYLAMEYVIGDELSKWAANEERDFAEIVATAAEIADGLSYAHSRGIIHRDIKPSNIIVRPDGTPVIIDFGIAMEYRDADADHDGDGEPTIEQLTEPGQLIGTPPFMSPEQVRLIRAPIGAATDIWSLGVVLCGMLNGHRLFDELPQKDVLMPDLLLAEAERRFSPAHLNQIKPVLLKALEWNPERRFSAADDFATALRGILDNLRFQRNRKVQVGSAPSKLMLSAELFVSDDVRGEAASLGDDEFARYAEEYSEYLTEDLRADRLAELIGAVWRVLIGNPFLTSKLMTASKDYSEPVKSIVRCVGLLVNRNAVDVQTICECVGSLVAIRSSNGPGARESALLIQRIIKALFYYPTHKLSPEVVAKLLKESVYGDDQFWLTFATDLRYRLMAGFIKAGEDAEQVLDSQAKKFVELFPNSSLARVEAFVSKPLEISRTLSFEAFREKMLLIAADATNEIEAAWAITAYLLTSRLYVSEIDITDQSSLILEVLEVIPPDVRQRSPRLIAMYLKEMLRSFVRRRDVDMLVRYENEFRRLMRRIHPLEKLNLQADYAACLFLGERQFGRGFLPSLSIEPRFANGTMIQDSLLSNPLLSPSRFVVELAVGGEMSRRQRQKWLLDYMDAMIKGHVAGLVKANPLNIRSFGAVLQVYENRLQIGSIIAPALRDAANEDNVDARFFARATSLFSLVSANSHIGLMLHYAQRALDSGEYDVRVADSGIGRCLFRCYYFGSSEEKKSAAELTRRLADIVGVGKGEPTFGWAFVGAAFFHWRQAEKDFVRELYWAGLDARREQKNGDGIREADFVLRFTDRMNEVVHEFERKGSYFAMVVARFMNQAELWNLIATTVYENRRTGDPKPVAQAALFYSYAKAFAKSSGEYDQKYWYNFIRCQSQYFEMMDKLPTFSFCWDVANFLGRHDSSLFNYKEECLVEFLRLLEAVWPEMSENFRLKMNQIHDRNPWLRKMNMAFIQSDDS